MVISVFAMGWVVVIEFSRVDWTIPRGRGTEGSAVRGMYSFRFMVTNVPGGLGSMQLVVGSIGSGWFIQRESFGARGVISSGVTRCTSDIPRDDGGMWKRW